MRRLDRLLVNRIAGRLLAACLVIAGLASCNKGDHGRPLADSTGNIKNLGEEYVILAWSDQGIYAPTPSYDELVLHPPYVTLKAQVIRRGNPPSVVTEGITVEYGIVGNTFSYGKGSYSGFWDNSAGLFGIALSPNTGLNFTDPTVHNGLSGTMLVKGERFEAEGIPATPILDDGTRSTYQVAEIVVKDGTGTVIGSTECTLPVSDEISCGKCHPADPTTFRHILAKHDARYGTTLDSSRPVLCARCHASPFLGASARLNGVTYLSEAMHRSHAERGAACYDCHPGDTTRFSRSVRHTADDGNCRTCHGEMAPLSAAISSNTRVPWVNEPACSTCHGSIWEVETFGGLFRQSSAHGGILCPACHGSPHATVESTLVSDNAPFVGLQSKSRSLGTCSPCHGSSKGKSPFAKFDIAHGGETPENASACNVCHTAVSFDTDRWPHAFFWVNRP